MKCPYVCACLQFYEQFGDQLGPAPYLSTYSACFLQTPTAITYLWIIFCVHYS